MQLVLDNVCNDVKWVVLFCAGMYSYTHHKGRRIESELAIHVYVYWLLMPTGHLIAAYIRCALADIHLHTYTYNICSYTV